MLKTPHELKVDAVREAIEELWTDKTVSLEEIIGSLVTLIGEIEVILDALRTDL